MLHSLLLNNSLCLKDSALAFGLDRRRPFDADTHRRFSPLISSFFFSFVSVFGDGFLCK